MTRFYRMDIITQTALGATIGQAGFQKRFGNKALIVGGLCGLFPDLDMIVQVTGDWNTMVYHRTFTHSLPMLALFVPLLAWGAYRFYKRKEKYLHWLHLAFWATLSHPILDLFTSYGTQLFYPFSSQKYALDAIPVIDPMYTIWLFLAITIGWKKSDLVRKRLAFGALFITSFYIAIGYCQRDIALHLARKEMKKISFEPQESRAISTPLNIWLKRIVARNEQGDICIAFVSTLHPKKMKFHVVKCPSSPFISKILESKRGKIFRKFTMNMMSVEIKKEKESDVVYLQDQRYGLITKPCQSVFRVKATFNSKKNRIEIHHTTQHKFHIFKELQAVWNLLF